MPSSTVAKPVKLAQKYPTWGAWVDSGDWAKTSPTGTLTLPANASEIMILALDPDVSVTQLARVTSRDQVLAARISEVPRCLGRDDAIHELATAIAHRRLALELGETTLQLRHPHVARGLGDPR